MNVKKICYCGSLRKALDAFKKAEYDSVIKGEIALLPCCMFVDIEREYGAESDYKTKADDLHKRKIDISDEVVILNVGGYIGSSTMSELEYAKSIGKPIRYLEPLTGIKEKEEKCLLSCTSCEAQTDINQMISDSGDNWFCLACYKELAPVMKAEYDEAVKRGEIEEFKS